MPFPKPHAFYTVTHEDPLFAAEGLDVDNALWALDELEHVTGMINDLWKRSNLRYRLFCFRYPFTHSLHPISFLREFLCCERERRRFLINPTQGNAKRLIKNYKQTVSSLEENIRLYREAHMAIKKLDKNTTNSNTYYFHKNMVTFDEIVQSIDDLAQNVKVLRKEINEREKISNHSSESGGVKLQISYVDPIPEKRGGEALSEKLQYILTLEEKGLPLVIEKYGPIFYKLPHFDEKPTTHQFFVYITKNRKNEFRQLRISMPDRRYFLPLDESQYSFHEDKVIYEPLIRRGIPYWHQSAISFYSTRDLGYYADLATIVDIKRRPFLNQALVKHEKSSLLDLILWNGVAHERSYFRMAQIKAKGNKLPSPLYNFIARSYPSLYYLSFNRSVWRMKNKPNFLGSRFSKDSAYKTLDEIHPPLSREMLKKIFLGPSYRQKDWGGFTGVEK